MASLFANSPADLEQEERALSVLILDDERHDRHRLARLCSRLPQPCAVQDAKSLHEFAQHLDRETFHLILLDYALPDGTGLDGLHMVRLSARNLNTPTLMISGQSQPDIAQEAKLLGCCDYLSKDALTPDRFSIAVGHALANSPHASMDKKDAYAADDVAHLLSLCAARSAQDVKPMVSRMMRQLRDIRARSADQADPALSALEQNCLSLWSFLIEAERETGETILNELTHDALTPLPGALHHRQKTPPSPFGRRTH